MFRAEESHGEQDQVRSDDFFATRNLGHVHLAILELPSNAYGANAGDIPLAVVDELFAENVIGAWVVPELLRSFFMSVVGTENPRPLWPWVIRSTVIRWTIEKFEVHQLAATVSQACADAIATGITTSDDNNAFTFRGDELAVGMLAVEQARCVCRQEFHCEVNTIESSTWDRQIARLRCTRSEQYCIVFGE